MHTKRNTKTNLYYFFLILPAFLLFSLFFIYPFFKSIFLSFTDAFGYNKEIHFIGFQNYKEAITNPNFCNSLFVTFKYTLFVAFFANLLALGFAFLLEGNIRFKNILRAIFFLPNLMSLLIVGFVWVFLYGSVYRSFLDTLDISGKYYISWLGSQHLAVFSIGITAIWQCAGYYMLIYIAALQGISEDLCEAAAIDGANKWDILCKVKFPMILPTIIMNIILLVTSCLKAFDYPMAMTSGGPAGSTTTIALLIYNTGFRSNRTGYATAQSIILFLIITMVTIVLLLFQKKKGDSTE